MGFTCGIVGLPNVGKSTLFNALTSARVDASNYPFCTIDPNVGVVAVPDPRLDRLFTIFKPAAKIPTTIEFLDIAGLVKGASKGEGLGNQFLSHIRTVDAIAHVVRCFTDDNVAHVYESLDPLRDIEVVETEMVLKDFETVDRRWSDSEKRAKSGDKKLRAEAEFYHALRNHLGEGRPARQSNPSTDEEAHWLRDLQLLSNKPVMYVCNINEASLGTSSPLVASVQELAATRGATTVLVSAEVEEEVAQLDPGERKAFLDSLGLAESGLDRMIREGYSLLRLLTFFTVNEKEVHAWTVKRGTLAPGAAGAVHSDFERGFIRAEVMKFADLERLGSEHALREHGLIHSEGRDYAVQDGDVLLFRFNV